MVYVTNWTGGVPDPDRPGQTVPDLLALAITDENTGEMLDKAKFLAGFTLQDVGGPPIDERPDATGLFSDGRFADFGEVKTATGQAGNLQRTQQNRLHSVSVTDDGERVYVGRNDSRVLRARFRSCRSASRRRACGGHRWLPSALDQNRSITAR